MFNHQTSALLADPVWPGVWRGDQLENAGGMVTSSGNPALDAALPGGGWPQGALIELLHSGGCLPEWLTLTELDRHGGLSPRRGLISFFAPMAFKQESASPHFPRHPSAGSRAR